MPTMPPTFRSQGSRTRAAVNREADQRRGTARARGYSSAWDKASKGHLQRSPVCRYCEIGAFGPPAVRAAMLVDHLIPHRGDQALFWDSRLWVSSCVECHSGPKQAAERQGRAALDQLVAKLGLPPQ